MELSCCIWALSGSVKKILPQIANVGFKYIDIQPFVFAHDALQT